MAATVLFVSENKVKQFTTLNQNLDQALLTSMIYLAQEIHLQPVIGGKGYEYYQNVIRNSNTGGTVSNADRIMLDEYIAPIVIWAGYYEAIPEIWARKMNKSIVVGNTEQGNAIDLKTMQYFRDNALSKYQFYIQRLLDRVQAYSGDYPWFYTYNDKDGLPSTNQNYFAGITFTPGFRRPPNRNSWYRNLPLYQGPEYDACVNCD